MSDKFNFEEALKALQSGQAITGKDGVLAPLIKQLTEAALEGEIDHQSRHPSLEYEFVKQVTFIRA